ncbi:MAG: alpha/beta fold hydrolase [Elusimicrobiales bacterium]|jgi:esterase/lipase
MRKTAYLACILAAWPCFAYAGSLEQLEGGAAGSISGVQVRIPAGPADVSGYNAAVSEFEAYRDSKRAGIRNTDNLPFLLVHGARTLRTVVMIHGLADSPWYMRELGEILYQQGYNVVSILLPGHGTKPEDLLAVTQQQWRQEVDRGLGIAAGLGERISLAGFSAGGSLALDALRRHPELKAEKLFLFSPALAMNEENQVLVSLGCQAPQLIIKLKGQYDKDAVEDDPHSYNKKAVNSVCQLYAVMNANTRWRGKILESIRSAGTAVFAVESSADRTVSPVAVTDFIASLPDSADRAYVWYPPAEGIAHADVPRPETNPRFGELRRKLKDFTAADRS